ncbi:MAG: trehalose synthase [Gemmatimonas sp.]|nr:trehalose synthase [Gemmatimonas sp.]
MTTDVAWYKNAIIYALDVETFMDSDGDGVGDFQGLIESLDYLSGLGVTCLWLQPFYPTPNHDDGYDVADYYGIDSRLGTLGDFVVFMREARERGMHVIVELVVNHTSIEHPWFQEARRDPRGKYRDFYIWHEEPPSPERRGGVVFPGKQVSNWEYDAEAGAHYWHWFYAHQPDLNTGNPAVQEEIKKIMGFWLELGVAGFRIDAAAFLFKRKGLAGTYPEEPELFLGDLRRFLTARSPEAILLAEADVSLDELSFFLGEGERMNLIFNFILNNYFFLGLARESAEPIREALLSLPTCPEPSQYANFVRNHDELNLDRLPDDASDLVFERFAPDPAMRVYERGIRRRLPPMLGGDRRHIEMVYSLLFSLPGTPVLRYGDEIGMGENLDLPERLSVRTPMQWTDGVNGGFSTADPSRLVRPMVEGELRPERVNVADQRRDPRSLLNYFLRLIRTRKECPELGSGTVELLDTNDSAVLAHRCDRSDGVAIAIHNLSGEERKVSVALSDRDLGNLIDLIGDRQYEPVRGRHAEMHLEPYAYRWLRTDPQRSQTVGGLPATEPSAG